MHINLGKRVYFQKQLMMPEFVFVFLATQFWISPSWAQTGQAQLEFNQFQQQAEAYETELGKSVQAIELMKSKKQRYEQLEKQSLSASQVNKAKIFSEIEKCREAVARDEAEKKEANNYLLRTNQYLQRLKSKAQIEAHNLSEDKEKADEDATKAKQAQAQQAWDKEILANSERYHQQMNEDYNNYGYGYPRRGRGNSYRHGRFYGYHYEPEGKQGGTSFPSASHVAHASAAHHR